MKLNGVIRNLRKSENDLIKFRGLFKVKLESYLKKEHKVIEINTLLTKIEIVLINQLFDYELQLFKEWGLNLKEEHHISTVSGYSYMKYIFEY